jgi:hypothetical protein
MELTHEERKELPSSAFAIPEDRKYPIENEAHAKDALSRVSAFGSAKEKARVRQSVHDRYPYINIGGLKDAQKLSPKSEGGESLLVTGRFPARDKAMAQLGSPKVLQVHDDGDLTVQSSKGIFVVTTEGGMYEQVTRKQIDYDNPPMVNHHMPRISVPWRRLK